LGRTEIGETASTSELKKRAAAGAQRGKNRVGAKDDLSGRAFLGDRGKRANKK